MSSLCPPPRYKIPPYVFKSSPVKQASSSHGGEDKTVLRCLQEVYFVSQEMTDFLQISLVHRCIPCCIRNTAFSPLERSVMWGGEAENPQKNSFLSRLELRFLLNPRRDQILCNGLESRQVQSGKLAVSWSKFAGF